MNLGLAAIVREVTQYLLPLQGCDRVHSHWGHLPVTPPSTCASMSANVTQFEKNTLLLWIRNSYNDMTVLGFLSGKKIDKVVTFPRFDISEMRAQLHMHNVQILEKGHLKRISYIEEIVCSSMSQTPFNPQVWVEWYRFTWPPTKFLSLWNHTDWYEGKHGGQVDVMVAA